LPRGRDRSLVTLEPQPMGKLDRRHSLKMNRRKAQEKKKIRAKRPKSAKATAAAALPATPAKKARAAKPAAEG
jgi:hypothetical protein